MDSSEDYEAQFQEDRRAALAGSYGDFLKHKADYRGVYNYSGLPWKDDPPLKYPLTSPAIGDKV